MKEFIGEVQQRLPDAEGRARFLFAHSSGALLQVTLKPGTALPHDRQRVIVLGDLVGAALDAHEIVPERDFADMERSDNHPTADRSTRPSGELGA
jgi:hypothetical protein